MSIQRWDIWGYEWEQDAHPDGDWVLYADHQQAMLNAALTHEREWLEGTAKARADALQAARDAVAGLPWDNSGAIDPVDALAAIDGLRAEPYQSDTESRIGQDADREPYNGQWHRDLYGGDD